MPRRPRGPATARQVTQLGSGTAPDALKSLLEGVRSQKQPGSALEDHLLASMRASNLPEPEREYRFHSTRRWRFDFAWPALRLAVEIEGGIYRGGGHTHVKDLKRDMEKGNAASLAGWRVLRFHGDQVRSGEARAVIEEALRDPE